jgi:cytochrome c biogenesis protein CcmG, thiol:disulfide interchange protein DsbE
MSATLHQHRTESAGEDGAAPGDVAATMPGEAVETIGEGSARRDVLEQGPPARTTDPRASGSRGARGALALAACATALVLLVLGLRLRAPTAGPEIGAEAPDFRVETFAGESFTRSSLRGRVVVLNFWASWCVSCAYEATDLEAVWRDYRGRGVVVLGIDYTDTDLAALAYLSAHGVTYPNGPDEGTRISNAYRVAGVPETVVLDDNGRVVALHVRGERQALPKLEAPIVRGSGFTPDDLRSLLDRLLADQGTDG